MTSIDAIALWVVHVGGAAVITTALVYLFLWGTLTLTWKIYQRVFDWEHLVRTVRHCYNQTWLKPPAKAWIARRRAEDGSWVYEDDYDDCY